MIGSILSVLLPMVIGAVAAFVVAIVWIVRLPETWPVAEYQQAESSIWLAGATPTVLGFFIWVPASTTLTEVSAAAGLPDFFPLLHAFLSILPGIAGNLLLYSRPAAPVDIGHRIRWLATSLVMLTLAVVATIGVLRVGELVLPPLVLVAVLAACALLARLRRRQFPTRAPDEEEKRQLANALDTTGFPIDRVRIVEGAESEVFWRPMRVGFGRFAELFVPSDAFETDEEVLETIVIRLTLSSRSDWLVPSFWGSWFAVVVLLGVLSNPAVAGVGLLVLFASVLVANVVGRRVTYRYDTAAAEIVGPERMIESLERQLDQIGDEGRAALLLLMKPAACSRIKRLESRTAGQSGEPGSDAHSTD